MADAEARFFRQPKVLRLTWALMMKMRHNLRMNIYPFISTAFVKLHYYYRAHETKSCHSHYKLVIAALASSAKTFNYTIPYPQIFSVMLEVCRSLSQTLPADALSTTFSLPSFNDRSLESTELSEIQQCEMEILMSHGVSKVRMPYDLIEESVIPHVKDNDTIMTQILVNHCAILCCSDFCEIPIDVNALVLAEHALSGHEIPTKVGEWLESVRALHSSSTIEQAKSSLCLQLKSVSKTK